MGHAADTFGEYKLKYIGSQDVDARKSVILLRETYNSTLLGDNYAIGTTVGDGERKERNRRRTSGGRR